MKIDLLNLTVWTVLIIFTLSFWFVIFKLGLEVYLILAACLAVYFIIKKEYKK